MKKLILSSLAMASLAFAANAVTNMCVKTVDGKVVRFDVENVTEVYYEETADSITDQGVTVSGKVGPYTYVDLGLPSGIKWATYNVGATKPAEYGDYFAWGETKPKEDYSWNQYKWSTGDIFSITKYCADSIYGTVDNKKVLETEDDAATVNWGDAWRMPTREEVDELNLGCDWEWVEDFNGSGVNGILGISRTNGSSIFLPASGYRDGADFFQIGENVYFLSSSRHDYMYDAFSGFYFDRVFLGGFSRAHGIIVRAVLR